MNEARSLPLQFRLGDLTLFSWAMTVEWRSFAPLDAPQSVQSLIFDTQCAGAEGGYLEGLPVKGVPGDVIEKAGGWLIYAKSVYRRHIADIGEGYDAYMAQFSSKTRSTLRRKIKKFAAASGDKVDWRCYTAPDEMESFFQLARQVSSVTYQERLLKAGLPDGPEFVENLKRLAGSNSVRGYILFLDGVPVSYLYLPIHNRRAIYAYLGYVPEYADLSPGTVLQMFAIEDLCTHNVADIFDFTQGEGQHKAMFGTRAIEAADFLILPASVRNRMVLRAHALWTLMEGKIGAWLDRLGIKTQIKRVLRRMG